ncbi:glycosyltransferase family 4 protein [Flectobacillus sp. BAB-3569]|uniref:glycosyltransferase family 4 protein n=1 Tax=Flectobacillus sp. BAB-3569 TaxID=1509483 RepID=UPI000BA428A1|nr:glycosyltransferase family 4 protein [Flectobacillus sp. BAB-3569]PAC30620.1 hypothetical protein BWI92_11330 [Flectobacillus sp. BAB-3569]
MKSSGIKIDYLICGRFHLHKYLKFVEKRGALGNFYYSYKVNYNFGVINKTRLHNFPLKEYLLYAGLKFLPRIFFDRYLRFLHKIWQKQVLNSCTYNGDIVVSLLHGNTHEILKEYKKKGIPVVGYAVNAHPLHQYEILDLEYRKNGIEYKHGELFFSDLIQKEVELCDAIICPSNWVKESYLRYSKKDLTKKIFVINYGLEVEDKISTESEIKTLDRTKEIKLLYVGLLTFRKGISYLCEAYEVLLQEGYKASLTLVGSLDDLYAPIISKFLKMKGVTHVPHIENGNMISFMKRYDLFIMPSLEDGFGVVISEALSSHLPVIVTQSCGGADLIQNGINGLIIQQANSFKIVEAIKQSFDIQFKFNNKELKQKSWEHYAEVMISTLSSIENNINLFQ